MTDLLSKPDEAHKPQLAAERKARMAMRAVWMLYLAAGMLTFAFRIWHLWNDCASVAECGTGVAKGLVWTVLWPFYWIFYVNGT